MMLHVQTIFRLLLFIWSVINDLPFSTLFSRHLTLQTLQTTILKASNVLMGFLYALVFLWWPSLLHEETFFPSS